MVLMILYDKLSLHLKILREIRPIKAVIQRLIVSAIFYGICMYIMSLMAVVSGIRYPRDIPVLPDLGFDLIPVMQDSSTTFPNVMIAISILATAVRCLFHEKGISIMRRFMIIHGICALLRCAVMATTSYPDPNRLCGDYRPPQTLGTFWRETVIKTGFLTCGDLMFSGHTLVYMISALTWNKYFTKPEKVIVWILELAAAVSLVATRMHYTNDVLIAMYTSVTVFYIYNLWALNKQYRDQIRVLSWLEDELKPHHIHHQHNTPKIEEQNLILTIKLQEELRESDPVPDPDNAVESVEAEPVPV